MDDVRKWKAVYRLLDVVSVEVFDCGTLCGCACCRCGDKSEDMGIYLLPGEHLMFENNREAERFLSVEKLPSVYFATCTGPEHCVRKLRPMQCRSFPLKPVFSDNGVLELIWNDEDLPYNCPVIENNMPIHDDFYKATYTAWTHLLKDKRIFNLVMSWS